MDIGTINSAIIRGTWSNDDLTSMIDAVKYARARLTERSKYALKVGQAVRFTSAKRGMTIQGTVNKIAIKYVTVATPQGLWKVPANMLEAV
jgi:hypothetical protein